MPHAVIRGANGRRHEVDFGDAPVRVEIYSSEETVEIFIEADFRNAPARASAFRPSQYPPPPVWRGHRRRSATCDEIPSCMLDVLRIFGPRLNSGRGFPFRERLDGSLVTEAKPRRSKTGPCPSEKGTTESMGSFPLPAALREAPRSRSRNLADDVAITEAAGRKKERGAESWTGSIRGILSGLPSGRIIKRDNSRYR
jgi:hypothetical protein